MTRRKKDCSKNEGVKPRKSKISFELEEDAMAMMLAHLDRHSPIKAEEEQIRKAVPDKVRQSRESAHSWHIDLHGCTLVEAELRIIETLTKVTQQHGIHKVKIITGKGNHSKGGKSILAQEIHSFVLAKFARYIVDVEDSPHEVKLGGIPLRGHFMLTLKGNPR